ncbi:hypothetical protein RB213_013511 [Colletotrichum asianum]|uniref:Uncharacterized protein n=2 Tax=Colletotrichum gloeosporioides species complex TaxID=2707338 RepID=A0A8H3WMP6_9PEZI|nr:hypothetical protein GQ607_002509 [Colletotrichum asianum]
MPPLRPWATIFEEFHLQQSRMSSTVFSMLPTSLQARLPLPPIKQLRKTVSLQTLTSSRQSHTRSLSGLDGVHSNTTQSHIISETEEHTRLLATEHHQSSRTYEVRSAADKQEYQQQQSEHQVQLLQAPQQSNVDWRWVQQGVNLINVARDDTRRPPTMGPGAEFERKAFIDGVEYILKALPGDLNDMEIDRLRASLPNNLRSPAGDRSHSPSRSPSGPRSILHRGVQTAVVNIFILIHLALPYIVLLIRLAARTEREYKLSERVVGSGMSFANTVGSFGMRTTGALYNVGDGRVGQALTEAIAWTVEGVTGGLSEGVGEGLSIVGAKRQ